MSIKAKMFAMAALFWAANGAAQHPLTANLSANYKYADLADLALAAPITAHVRIKSVERLPKEMTAGVRPGFSRQLVTADVIALIKASEGVPARIQYIVDLPVDSRGKSEKLKKSESLVFAAPAGSAKVRLVAPDAQVRWSPEAAKTVRTILSEAARAGAPPVIKGIASAFHSEGSIPGEGETQIFLASSDEKPISLAVQRRSGETPKWFVSQGEVVDEGTSQPRPESLLWYRIACTLPQSVPAPVTDGQSAETVAQIQTDYRLVLDGLGACSRARKAAR